MNRIIYLFQITTFLFVSSVFALSQTGANIHGKVTLGDSNTPLQHASIQIAQLNSTVSTDDLGNYKFTNVPAGRYTMVVHQQGFREAVRTVILTEGAALTVDFQMSLTGIKEQVNVTATGTKLASSETIQSTSTVDANQILERGNAGIGDILENQPGVAKRSATAASSRPVIRGFDGDRVLVAIDGMRDGSIAAFSENHAEPIDVFSLDRIEVVKGPSTLLYGSNAIGGVVNAISRYDENFHNGTSGYFSTIGGFNNRQLAASGGIEQGYKNWMLWGSGTGQRTSDYKAGGNFGRVDNTFTRSASGTAGFGYFGGKGFFTANYNYYQSRYGIPIDFDEDPPKERSIRLYRSNYRLNGFRDLDSFIESVKFTFDYSNYRQRESELEIDEEEGGADDEGSSVFFRNKVYSYRGVFSQKKYNKLTGTFGFDGYRRNYSTEGEEILINGKVVQDSFSVYALEGIALERVSFQFGGRVENNHYRPDNADLKKRDLTGFSGAVGMRVALWEGGAFVANYSHASRLPDLEEFYNNGPHDDSLSFEIGDPNLKVEQSDGIDVSLRHQSDRLRAEANFYYYNIRNFIFLVPTGEIDEDTDLPIATYVQGNSRFTGTELSLDLTANKFLNVLTGLDYVRAELTNGIPLPRIAPLRGRFGLDAHYKNLSVRPEFIAVGDQNRVFTNETRTPGYGVFNVASSYILPSKHFANIFSINAYNLTDKLYYNHISFIKNISPEIGRGVRFSYTIRFY